MDSLRWCLLATFSLCLLPTVAAAPAEFFLIEDRFVTVPVEDLDIVGGCGPLSRPEVRGQITVNASANHFTFHEAEAAVDEEILSPDVAPDTGSARAVCALASYEVTAPPGTDHIHVRFDADRHIEQQVTLEYHMPQELRLFDGSGSLLEAVDVFPWDDGSHDRARFAELGTDSLPHFPVPADVGTLGVGWYFEDQGASMQRNQPGAISGQAFHATVWNPVIEISSQPHPTPASTTERREGTTIHADTIIPVNYAPGDNQTNLRVRGPLGMSFSHVLTESGERWDDTGILPPGAEYGPRLGFILLERNSAQGFTQVTLSDSRMAADGGSMFYVVFTESSEIAAAPGLIGMNAALAAIPLAFAAMALQRIAGFHREAFGGYKRTARKLGVTLALILTYYVVAIVGAIQAGWFTMASVLPPNREALLLYLQMVLAVAAFGWLWMTGSEMYRITRPAARQN